MKYLVLSAISCFLLSSNLLIGQETIAIAKKSGTNNRSSEKYIPQRPVKSSAMELKSVFSITTEKESEIPVYFNATAIPISDFIVVTSTHTRMGSYFYKVYNKEGNLLKKAELNGNETLIDLSKISPETYYLKITDNQNELKTFKVVKH